MPDKSGGNVEDISWVFDTELSRLFLNVYILEVGNNIFSISCEIHRCVLDQYLYFLFCICSRYINNMFYINNIILFSIFFCLRQSLLMHSFLLFFCPFFLGLWQHCGSGGGGPPGQFSAGGEGNWGACIFRWSRTWVGKLICTFY